MGSLPKLTKGPGLGHAEARSLEPCREDPQVWKAPKRLKAFTAFLCSVVGNGSELRSGSLVSQTTWP